MKKLLILLLCVCMIIPTCTFAAESMTIGFGSAAKHGDSVTLPMYISDIPDKLTDISALTIHFTFDTSVLEFVGLKDGAIKSISSWYNLSEKTPGKVLFSWFDASGNNALTDEKVGKTNPIFYAEFKIADDTVDMSHIRIQTTGAYDFSSKAAENIQTVDGAVFMYNDTAIENAYGINGKSLIKITDVPDGKVPVVDGLNSLYFGNGTFAVITDSQYSIVLNDAVAMPEKAEFGKLHADKVTSWDALVTNDEALEREVAVFDDIQMYIIADLNGNGMIEAVDALNINKISLFKDTVIVPNWVDAE